MKKFLLLLVTAGLILASCDQPTPEKATKYYNSIVLKVNKVINEENEFYKTFKNYKGDEMLAGFNGFEKELNDVEGELSKIEPFYEDASLVKSANNLIDGYKKVTPLYKEKVEIESLPDTLYTIEKQNRSRDIMEEIDLVVNTLIEIYKKEGDEFSKKYGVIQKDNIKKMLEEKFK